MELAGKDKSEIKLAGKGNLKTNENSLKTSEKIVKSSDKIVKSSDKIVKSTDKVDKTVKSNDKMVKSSENIVKSNDKIVTANGKLAVKKGKKSAENSNSLLKAHRLIVRNVSFLVDEKFLTETLKSFGNIVECLVPKNSLGKSRGFAIVQFDLLESARKCMEELNGKKLKGRPIAIDWCLAKNAFEKFENSEEKEPEGENEGENEEESEPEGENEFDGESENDGEIEIENDSDTNVESENDSDTNVESDSEMDCDCDTNVESDIEMSACEEETGMDICNEKKEPNSNRIDSKKNTEIIKPARNNFSPFTVFIRNVSFDASERDLRTVFSTFGQINYAKLVMDRETGIPKGTAFVNFASEESYECCLAKANESNLNESFGKSLIVDESRGIHILGRPVHVMPALDKSSAQEMESKKGEKESNDKRNLHLLSEGYITPNCTLAKEGNFTEKELEIRRTLYLERQAKLKNLNFFVSQTRISLRNLSLTLDAKQLKEIFVNAGCKPFMVKQVKIVRSKDRKDQEGKLRSLGYGFVEMGDHEKALEMVRLLNQKSVEFFGNARRPIIEFAIENKLILEKREKRNFHMVDEKKEASLDIKRLNDKSKNKENTNAYSKFDNKNKSRGVPKNKSKYEPMNNKTATNTKNSNNSATNKRPIEKYNEEKPLNNYLLLKTINEACEPKRNTNEKKKFKKN